MAENETPKKHGNTKEIDLNQLEQMAMIGCTYREMAACLGVVESTLIEKYKTIIDQLREKGKRAIRAKQVEVALRGSVPMLIWLGKQMLDQREKIDQVNTHVIEKIREVEALPIEEKRRRLQMALKSMEDMHDNQASSQELPALPAKSGKS